MGRKRIQRRGDARRDLARFHSAGAGGGSTRICISPVHSICSVQFLVNTVNKASSERWDHRTTTARSSTQDKPRL